MATDGAGVPRYDWQELWDLANPPSGLGRWQISRYDGYCRGCGARFWAGELIRWYADEDGWLAECCGVEP